MFSDDVRMNDNIILGLNLLLIFFINVAIGESVLAVDDLFKDIQPKTLISFECSSSKDYLQYRGILLNVPSDISCNLGDNDNSFGGFK